MYYLCKFSESWSVYDGSTNSTRQLNEKEVHALAAVFPQLFNSNKILAAIKVEGINPNKLLQLPPREKL